MAKLKKSVSELRESGSRHYTKEQLEEREDGESAFNVSAEIEPPSYLQSALKDRFTKIASILAKSGKVTSLHSDVLARYLIAEQNYLRATNKVTSAINAGASDDANRWSAIQDRYFKQMRSCEADLGIAGKNVVVQMVTPSIAAEEDDLFGS
ncbi:MAG: P27 family phage terminase small subunit [Oscillospiraceae bacterium]|nr:P27 family phage terminase small subunit [Oscillospiraceae bacterium]